MCIILYILWKTSHILKNITYSKTPVIQIPRDQFNRFEVVFLKLEGIKFSTVKKWTINLNKFEIEGFYGNRYIYIGVLW